MAQSQRYDAVVVGSGPNGLAAAITMIDSGRSVAVYEAAEKIGGGMRSAELTLPGFLHDICSAVYPLAIGSPLFRSLPLAQYGLEWVQPPSPLAHPLDDGSAVILERSLYDTAAGLGRDGHAYRRLMQPLVDSWHRLDADLLGPLRWPHKPVAMMRFVLSAIRPAWSFSESWFAEQRARALVAGLSAHSMLPLEAWGSAAFGLVLATTGHVLGWPIARRGSQSLADALASYLRSKGGEVYTNAPVRTLDELPSSRVILCDVTPRQLLALAGDRLSPSYRHRLQRYRYGMGAFKIDWALSEPVPWKAKACARAATVHLGGTLPEIAASERAAWRGDHTENPFVLAVQPSLFDSSRAPETKHTLWTYCHVPNGSTFDMTQRIEAQIERYAPGFRDTVLARSVAAPAELERRNPNLIGGDINGGAPTLDQLFLRPTVKLYSTSARGLYLCSASTPPGGGVHGMCGYFAARQALREFFNVSIKEAPG
jgi:phytoene dehydrogenase-like protein